MFSSPAIDICVMNIILLSLFTHLIYLNCIMRCPNKIFVFMFTSSSYRTAPPLNIIRSSLTVHTREWEVQCMEWIERKERAKRFDLCSICEMWKFPKGTSENVTDELGDVNFLYRHTPQIFFSISIILLSINFLSFLTPQQFF
jgi:hypothetical protein